ncbi:hypothetical protein RJ639_006834 [Escallonia herrerae]|uniref:Uncharacterized protein n=1 Tax=Escallonia herrerae TaxID=1293975 RepID=A0AA88VVZ1_9ASTE|nr:hypothetical protein RJ639_006834 [Escallonia herrerae]
MGGGRSTSGDGGSSSGEEDGDADWRAAIDSVAATTTFGLPKTNGFASAPNASTTNSTREEEVDNNDNSNEKPQNFKHYQIKAQKLLEDIVEKSMEIVRDPVLVTDNNAVTNDVGIRLFKDAPCGILFNPVDELQGPRKRPRIIPGEEIDEQSKKFKHQLRSAAVDGTDIIDAARVACQKSLAKLQAKDAAAKTAAKREEERVAELKRVRGERWLPSVARDRQATVVDGFGQCITTLWRLQERRFAAIFEALSSVVSSFTMALVVCFVTVYQRRSELGVAFL